MCGVFLVACLIGFIVAKPQHLLPTVKYQQQQQQQQSDQRHLLMQQQYQQQLQQLQQYQQHQLYNSQHHNDVMLLQQRQRQQQNQQQPTINLKVRIRNPSFYLNYNYGLNLPPTTLTRNQLPTGLHSIIVMNRKCRVNSSKPKKWVVKKKKEKKKKSLISP